METFEKTRLQSFSRMQLPGSNPESLIIVTAQWDCIRNSGGFLESYSHLPSLIQTVQITLSLSE